MGYFYSDEELAHHGILGQKWGVRRFETEGGHLTVAGKQRYDGNPVSKAEIKAATESARAKTAEAKANLKANKKYANSYNEEDVKKYRDAAGMYDLRKRQEKDAKLRAEMQGKKVTSHQQKLIDKYKEQGMSQKDAELAAYKRAKLEKTLAIAGTVTVAAATAYGIKKYHDYTNDVVLKAGSTPMKRISADGSFDLHDTFYAAGGKHDANKYVGIYGTQLKRQGADKVFQKTIGIKEDLKIASDKNAKNTMAEVLSKTSKANRDEVIDSLTQMKWGFPPGKQKKTLEKGIADIRAGKYDTKAAYDALNINMTGGNKSKVFGEFKEALREKGYGGINDRNDASYSGYNAKTARIIFDAGKVAVDDVRQVSNAEVNSKNTRGMLEVYGRSLAPQIAGIAAGSAALSRGMSKARDTQAINEYKQEHPNTRLSNDEILENVYGGNK